MATKKTSNKKPVKKKATTGTKAGTTVYYDADKNRTDKSVHDKKISKQAETKATELSENDIREKYNSFSEEILRLNPDAKIVSFEEWKAKTELTSTSIHGNNMTSTAATLSPDPPPPIEEVMNDEYIIQKFDLHNISNKMQVGNVTVEPESFAKDMFMQHHIDLFRSGKRPLLVMPMTEFCMRHLPKYFNEQVTKVLNTPDWERSLKSVASYDIITVLRHWNLLDDYRLGTAVSLICKNTDETKSDLLINLKEARTHLDSVIQEIEFSSPAQ